MPNLKAKLTHDQFVTRLTRCEQEIDAFSPYEQQFIRDLRKHYESRAEAEQFNVTPWSPTVKQWNMLFDMSERV